MEAGLQSATVRVWIGFNPTSIRITVGRKSCCRPEAGTCPFQSLLQSGLPLEAAFRRTTSPVRWGFNPTSIRITVGSKGAWNHVSTLPIVSILLQSGLPLEALTDSPIFPSPHPFQSYFNQDYRWKPLCLSGTATGLPKFQSYFNQDYRWKASASRESGARFRVSILLQSGLPLEGSPVRTQSCPVIEFQSYFNPGLPLEEKAVAAQKQVHVRFNPTSIRITVGSGFSQDNQPCTLGFQSYFNQDYRWK